MRNNETDNYAQQMNKFSKEQIQSMIDNGTFFDITQRGNCLSMHIILNESIVTCYQIDSVWYCKY